MATSGSKNFSITRADIIGAALRKLGVFDSGEAVSGDDTSNASLQLNVMVKEWVARGADLFLREEQTLFLQPNTKKYALTTDEITADTYIETTLSAAEASGQTVISLTTSTGMTASDRIGIKMDDNTLHWTTIVSVDSSTQVTITAATDDDAASGNKVYTYTNKSSVPQKILYAFRSDTSGNDTEITIIGENEYRRQSNKDADGPPVEIWYNRKGNQATGELFVWPDNGGKTWDKIVLISNILPDDFDAGGDNPDFPIEWANCLIWSLAAEMASEYGISEPEQARLWATSEFKLSELFAYDTEDASVIFAMDDRYRHSS